MNETERQLESINDALYHIGVAIGGLNPKSDGSLTTAVERLANEISDVADGLHDIAAAIRETKE